VSSRGEHLHYVDLVRVLTVALVIGTHVLALAPIAPTILNGLLGIVFHVSREVFFLLTAFVLTFSTGRRKMHWPTFWRRRYLFVLVPYLVWTVLYFLADGAPFLRANLVTDLLTGEARYHLYFLLVSMQIYLIFPLIRRLLQATEHFHGVLLAGCAVFQLIFSLAAQQQWQLGALSGWIRSPDALLPSYLGYILAGAVAAWHRDVVVDWTRRNTRRVYGGCAAAVALGMGVYLIQVLVDGQPPLQASFVFQPVVVVESVAIAWAFLATGLRWQDRGRPGEQLISAGSDASFGIYLIHPLILQGALLGATPIGLVGFAQTVPDAAVLAVLVLVFLPVLYLASGLVTALVRRTPVSLALTGRTWLRPARPTVSAQSRDDLALANSGGPR
jgi:surface polysaccharide O-acyltransferase-like enzyme